MGILEAVEAEIQKKHSLQLTHNNREVESIPLWEQNFLQDGFYNISWTSDWKYHIFYQRIVGEKRSRWFDQAAEIVVTF